MATDPPPDGDGDGLTRRLWLKLTGTMVFGTTAVAGCVSGAAPSTVRLGYGGTPWRVTDAGPRALLAATLPAVGPTDGLVGYWPLDGSVGTATDAAGGNDGTVRGAPQRGVLGVYDTTAYAFGTDPDSYVEIADAGALRPETLTFAGWYRTDSGANSQTVLQKADARFGDAGYAVDVQTTNSLRAHVAVESGQAAVNPWGVATQDGVWHHVCCTWDGEALVCYLDGEEVARDDSQSGGVVHSDRPLYIGYGDNGYTTYYPMDGDIDDVRVYDIALTDADVRALVAEADTVTPAPTPTETPTPTPTDTPTATPTATPIPNDEFGERGFGGYGYGGEETDQ